MSQLNKHKQWSLNEINRFVDKGEFEVMKRECSIAFEIIGYLSYLDGSKITADLIKTLFNEKSLDSLEEG